MPIYPGRRAGTWRVTIWAQKRQHEEIVEGSRNDALECEARLRLSLRATSPTHARTAPAFSVFCLEYQTHAQARLGRDTWLRTRKYTVASLAAHFGAVLLSDLTTSMVDAYVLERRRTVAPSTMNAELRVLKTMLRFAREDCGYPIRDDLQVRRVSQVARRVHCWTSAEVQRLLACGAEIDPSFVPTLLFLLNTGMRKGEAAAAIWTWVDWRRGVLSVGPYDGWHPKSKRPREIPLSDALLAVLQKLPRASRWIFPTATGDRYRVFPQRRFKAITREAGLRGGPHTCRHTFASLFLAAGRSLFDLSAILGHSATRTTELYAHLLPGHLETARNAVNLDARGRNSGGTLAKRTRSA